MEETKFPRFEPKPERFPPTEPKKPEEKKPEPTAHKVERKEPPKKEEKPPEPRKTRVTVLRDLVEDLESDSNISDEQRRAFQELNRRLTRALAK